MLIMKISFAIKNPDAIMKCVVLYTVEDKFVLLFTGASFSAAVGNVALVHTFDKTNSQAQQFCL